MEIQNYTYLAINIIVFLGPLIGSLIVKVENLDRFFINFIKTFIIIGVPFIVWDSLVTSRGDWSFNPEYTTGIMLGNIPLEEAMFFFAIPFASLALYELILIFKKERKIIFNPKFFYLLSTLLAITAFIFRDYVYTSNILLLCSVFILFMTFSRRKNIFHTSNVYLFIMISFIPFFIVNTILTSLPIVIYSQAAITNFRIGTIPFEDFLYSFLMLGMYISTYYWLKTQKLK